MEPDYFSDWRQRRWDCSSCQWFGPGSEAAIEPFSELFEVNCPLCDGRLAVISYPTNEEVLRAAEAGNAEAIYMKQAQERQGS